MPDFGRVLGKCRGCLVCVARRRILVLAVVFGWSTASFAFPGPVVVRDDRGGGVLERIQIIQQYLANSTLVEIRGRYCLSACTLYLKLPTTCVMPNTVFGFHGPSSRIYGISLNATAFDHWSRIMANHYPEPLRSWFLNQGRHRIVGFHEFSGRDLIEMGIRRCPDVTSG